MRRTFINTSLLAFVLAVAAAVTVARLGAQQAGAQPDAKGKAQDKAQTARGAADKDPNVTNPPGANDPAKEPPAPASKGGQKSRGTSCFVTYDNYTPWHVEAFIDGSYCGTVSPFGELDCVTGDGWTTIYARARFTDGSMKYWGPRRGMCDSEHFTWELRR
jgi:hypothetical protein